MVCYEVEKIPAFLASWPAMRMRIYCGLVLLCGIVNMATATLRLPSIFASSMVLPQNTDIPFSGTSSPSATIEVQVDDAAALTTKASASGDWTVSLPPMTGCVLSLD